MNLVVVQMMNTTQREQSLDSHREISKKYNTQLYKIVFKQIRQGIKQMKSNSKKSCNRWNIQSLTKKGLASSKKTSQQAI
jgi:hypothetical protein